MKNYLYKAGPLVSLGLGLLMASFAQGATEPTGVIQSASDVTNLFCGALLWMFWGLIVLGVAMFIVGGYTYATSGGDSEKVSKATKTLTYAAIALVVALIAKGVPSLIYSFLGNNSGLNAC
jgi:hypothetical protein